MSDGNLDFGVGVNTDNANQTLKALEGRLVEVTNRVRGLSSTIHNHVDSMTKDLRSMLDAAQLPKGMSRENVLRKLNSAQLGALRNQSAGLFTQADGWAATTTVAKAEATTKAAIGEINSSFQQSIARISEAHLRAVQRGIRTTEPAVLAAASRTARSTETMIRRESNPAYQQALRARERQQEADAIRQDQIGRASFQNENTLARLNNKGGSEIMAVQANILLGYQAISMAFNSMKNSATFVVQLDKEFRQFQAITQTTNTQMVTLEKNLIAVSEATKFTALEVAQAATVMGQAGMSAREVSDSIGSVTLLATASGTDLASAVDLVTSTLSIFNLQANQTTTIANTMTAAINGSKLTIDKLALGFQYAGNIASQLGMTYTELTATLGALANSGIRSGSTLGTGLRQLLVDLSTPTEKFTSRLAALGLSQSDVDVKSRSLTSVLQTLKDAGFGVSDAFESFEVRAAASFSALSNNIDIIGMLQKQFILSSAAAEANEVQMKSLANTMDKFRSVLGTMAYNAFKPFIELLQKTVDGLADGLAVLNRYPALLQTVSIGFIGVGTAIVASKVGALFVALSRGLPILATFTAATTGVTGATTVMAGAAASSSKILTGLFAVISRHPFVMLLSVVTMAGTAIAAFGKSTDDAIDRTKALSDVLEGQVQAAQANVEATNQVITNLINHRDELNRDPILREAKILEVIQQFKELGLTVDATTTSVDELVTALNDLKEINFTESISALTAKIAANTALLQLYEAQTQKERNKAPASLREVAGEMLPFEQAQPLFRQSVGSNDPYKLIRPAFEQQFRGSPYSDPINRVLDFVQTGNLPKGGFDELSGAEGVLSAVLNQLKSELEVKTYEDKALTPAARAKQDAVINSLQTSITAIEALLGTAGPMINLQRNKVITQGQIEIDDRTVAGLEVQSGMIRDGYGDQLAQLQTTYNNKTNSLKEFSEQKSSSIADIRVASEDLAEEFKADMDALENAFEIYKKAFMAANPGTLESDLDASMQKMLGESGIPALKSSINDSRRDALKNAAEVDEAAAEEYRKLRETTLKTDLKEAVESGDPDRMTKFKGAVNLHFDEMKRLVDESIDSQLAQETEKTKREILELQRTSQKQDVETERNSTLLDLDEEITETLAKVSEAKLVDYQKQREAEMRAAVAAAKKSPSTSGFTNAVNVINSFYDQVDGELQQIALYRMAQEKSAAERQILEIGLQSDLSDAAKARELALSEINGLMKDGLADVAEAEVTQFRAAQEKAFSARIKAARRSGSAAQLNKAKGTINSYFDGLEKTIRDALAKKLEGDIGEYEASLANIAAESELATVGEARIAALADIESDLKDVAEAAMKVSLASVKASNAELISQIETLTTEISKASPGAVMDQLVAKYNELMTALQAGLQSFEMLDGTLNVSEGVLPTKLGAISGDVGSVMNSLQMLGWSNNAASGITGNLISESGLSPTVFGDGGTSFGIAQWHKERFTALREYSSSNGLDYKTMDAQIKFLNHELNTKYKMVGDALKNAKTPEEAAQIFFGFERFQGWNEPGVNEDWKAKRKADARAVSGISNTSANTVNELEAGKNAAIDAAQERAAKSAASSETRSSKSVIDSLVLSASASTNPASVRAAIQSVDKEFNDILAAKVNEFKVINKKALAENDPDVLDQLAQLEEQINNDRAQKLVSLTDDVQKAALGVATKPLEMARKKLEEAQKPENADKYTVQEINQLKRLVYNQEQAVLAAAVGAAEQKLAVIRDKLAEATQRSGETSQEALVWKQQEIEAEKELTAAIGDRKIVQDAASRPSAGFQGALERATNSFQMNSGFYKLNKEGIPELLTQAEQMESAWGNVLDGLSGGFENLFMNIASGSKTVGESFREMGLGVVQMFMQMIAKALAFQMIQAAIGGMGGGTGESTGILGSILSSVLTVPGAPAAAVPVPGAAIGEMISGNIQRDHVLRKVAPGEMILRQSAVSAIGEDNLRNLNALGNRRMSETVPGVMGQNQAGGGMVNVYVVSKDSVPPLGPNDIIATISDDINRKGTMRQLIKQVQMGAL